jgi:c-di-GMP-binding flagellar brake protein YcgR
MMGLNIFLLFPLQVSVSDFQFGKGSSSASPIATIVFLVVIVIAVAAIIILNASRNSSGTKGTSTKGTGTKTGTGTSGSRKLFSSFAFNRLVRGIGLDNEQIKMLNFVFRSDDVIDPEKSINTPALLDRHFKRAYRVIEQSSDSEQETQNRLFVLFSTRNILENSITGDLSSTRELKNDLNLTFNYGKNKLNVALLNNKTEHLTVEAPQNVLGTQIKIPNGTKLSVLFFTKNNKGFSFETSVTGYSSVNGKPAMHLAHSNHLKFLSQRRFRRKQALIACFFFLVYVEGSGKKQRFVVDKRRFAGTITDISVGGCSIKTTAPVQVGAKFKIEFTQGEKKVAAFGQALRTNRTGASTIIHVKFLKLTKKSMNTISAYAYEYANE